MVVYMDKYNSNNWWWMRRMEKLHAHLSQEKPLRDLALDERERGQVRGFGFLSLKPVLIVINLGDERKAGDRCRNDA